MLVCLNFNRQTIADSADDRTTVFFSRDTAIKDDAKDESGSIGNTYPVVASSPFSTKKKVEEINCTIDYGPPRTYLPPRDFR